MAKHCENILLYLDNEMNPAEKNNFRAHLESCEACQSFLSDFGKNYIGLSEPASVMTVTDKQQLWQRIDQSVHNTLDRSWKISKKWLVAAAIALFALNIFNVFTVVQNKEISYAYNQVSSEQTETWYESSALDNMIFDISKQEGTSNE